MVIIISQEDFVFISCSLIPNNICNAGSKSPEIRRSLRCVLIVFCFFFFASRVLASGYTCAAHLSPFTLFGDGAPLDLNTRGNSPSSSAAIFMFCILVLLLVMARFCMLPVTADAATEPVAMTTPIKLNRGDAW